MFPRSQLRIDVSPLLSIIVWVSVERRRPRKLTEITEGDLTLGKQDSLRTCAPAQFPVAIDLVC